MNILEQPVCPPERIVSATHDSQWISVLAVLKIYGRDTYKQCLLNFQSSTNLVLAMRLTNIKRIGIHISSELMLARCAQAKCHEEHDEQRDRLMFDGKRFWASSRSVQNDHATAKGHIGSVSHPKAQHALRKANESQAQNALQIKCHLPRSQDRCPTTLPSQVQVDTSALCSGTRRLGAPA